jgi:hypothetical protein
MSLWLLVSSSSDCVFCSHRNTETLNFYEDMAVCLRGHVQETITVLFMGVHGAVVEAWCVRIL